MLYQATHLETLNDWHAPFITFCYGFLGPVFGYPGGALVLQAVLLMLWPAQVLTKIALMHDRPVVRSVYLSSFGLISCLFVAMSGSIFKDILIACFLSLFLFANNLRRGNSDGAIVHRSGLAIAGAAAIGIALVRPTNIGLISATILIVLVLIKMNVWKIIFIIIAIVTCLVIVNNFVKHFLLHSRHASSEVTLIVFDLAGISTNLHQDLFTELSSGLPAPKERPWECYSPKYGDPFFWGACKDYRPAIEPSQSRLLGFWLRQITKHPLAYATHRLNYMVRLFSRDGTPNKIVVPNPPEYDYATNNAKYITEMSENMRVGIALWRPTIAYAPFGAIAAWWFNGPLGNPLLWTVLLVAGIFAGRWQFRQFRDPQTLIVAVGGLVNILMFAALGPSDDLRYLLPSMFCTIAVVVLTLESGAFSPVCWQRRLAQLHED